MRPVENRSRALILWLKEKLAESLSWVKSTSYCGISAVMRRLPGAYSTVSCRYSWVLREPDKTTRPTVRSVKRCS
jgi:hypothetical protein